MSHVGTDMNWRGGAVTDCLCTTTLSRIPFGMGQVIAKAEEEEVRLAREQITKKGEERDTRVRSIPLPRTGKV